MEVQTHFLYTVSILILCCSVVIDSDPTTKAAQTTKAPSATQGQNAASTQSSASTTNKTSHDASKPMLNGTLPDSWYGKNRGMLQRTVYVVLGITAIVIIYFGVRAWRTRRRRSKTRKYGLIATGADLEMEPLGNDMDDDEDDMTVFEQNGRRK